MINKEKRFKLHNLMFIYVATTIIVTAISFSKYVSTISTNTITKVAVMANTVSVDLELPISTYPGCEPIICPIVISNKDNDKICEVTQEFTIGIKRKVEENIPLVWELYKDEYCTQIIKKDENENYTSDDFRFYAGVEETKTYYLKIEWPEDKRDEKLAFEIDCFTIEVISTQID